MHYQLLYYNIFHHYDCDVDRFPILLKSNHRTCTSRAVKTTFYPILAQNCRLE